MIYIIIILFYLFGELFMFLKVMEDLKEEKNMPEFFIYGAAFNVIVYPITYPVVKLVDILESGREKKRRKSL